MSEVEFSQATPESGRVLKPFPDFEKAYQGRSAQQDPIAFPGILDQMAGQSGYDPNLIAGARTPFGSHVVIWLPRLGPTVYGGATAPSYDYQLCWRIRSLTDQNADQTRNLSSHFGRNMQGVPQEAGSNPVFLGSPGPRWVIPAAFESVQMLSGDETEPRVVFSNTALFRVAPPTAYQAPLAPNFPGPVPGAVKPGAAFMLSQGFFGNGNGAPAPNNGNAGYSGAPQYQVLETTAKGDELIILLTRVPTGLESADALWDFDGADQGLSEIFGTDNGTRAAIPNIGIYLFTGQAAT